MASYGLAAFPPLLQRLMHDKHRMREDPVLLTVLGRCNQWWFQLKVPHKHCVSMRLPVKATD